MAFWEVFLIILGSVIVGLVLSIAIIYGITRIQKKPFVLFPSNFILIPKNFAILPKNFILFPKKQNIVKENSVPEPVAILRTVEAKLAEQEETSLEELAESRTTAEDVQEPTQLPKSEIFRELETNLGIATSPWSGKLAPFQTTFWDNDNVKADPLLANFQEEITQVYIDIRLANSIVWLSNEVGHRSSDLDESYKQLCVKIAERLKKVLHAREKAK